MEIEKIISIIMLVYLPLHIVGIPLNLISLFEGGGTVFDAILNNEMNLFGKIVLTILITIIIPLWMIPELFVRLFLYLAYIGT